MMTRPRLGFTLIELLVVVGVIALLAGLILALAPMMQRSAKKQKTMATLAALHQLLGLSAAERGGTIVPAEHPLVGSREPRAQFIRAVPSAAELAGADPDLSAISWPYAAGDAVATTALALRGIDPRRLAAADRSRLLLNSDVCSDTDLPMLYGMPRRRLLVIAAGLGAVTDYQQLIAPPPARVLSSPAENDARFGGRRVRSLDAADATQALFDGVMGRSPAYADLVKSGAVATPTDDTTLMAADRVWGPSSLPTTRSGWLRAGTVTQTYRLRGPAFYDVWGREILVQIDTNQKISLLSAGEDGYFRWHPGDDGVFQTPPLATAPAGDDRDGSRDNLVLGE